MNVSGTNFGIYRPGSTSEPARGGGAPAATAPSAPSTSSASQNDRGQNQQLSDFVRQLEDYVPTIPDSITAHFLRTGGFDSSDPRIVRLISVATQKYVADIANDAMQHCKVRNSKHNAGHTKYSLTMEDLQPALADYGVTVRKPNYYN